MAAFFLLLLVLLQERLVYWNQGNPIEKGLFIEELYGGGGVVGKIYRSR
jgi:hypothetical protein